MKGSKSWHFNPYVRPSEKNMETSPFVTRLIPMEFGFRFDYVDNGCPYKNHTLYVREKNTDHDYLTYTIPYGTGVVEGLGELCEYEFYIKSSTGKSSKRRYVRTGKEIPSAVILDYIHPEEDAYDHTGRCPCSPSIVRLPSGDLFASIGIFVDREEFPALPTLTKTYRSKDDGATWEYAGDLLHCFNASLFVHCNKLYCLALNGDYTDLVIAVSHDEGKTWSAPVTILYGESPHRWGWHTSSMYPVEINGRLLKAIEYGHVEIRSVSRTGKEWKCADKYYDLAHHVGVLSIDKNADLMNPESWTMSELFYPEDIDPRQCIEGNIVETPKGVVNLLRTMETGLSLEMTVDISNPEKPMYNPRKITDFPLSAISKFEIKKDPVSGKYIAIGNDCRYGRKVLVMAVSEDFEQWRIAHIIEGNPDINNAFSYADFFFFGDSIYLLSRTGYNGTPNLHDTNMVTFHKVLNFRQYI